MDVHGFALRSEWPPEIGLVADCSGRCAAEPSPAARATITCDRKPIPPWKGGGDGSKCWLLSSSWAGAIAARPVSVKRPRHGVVSQLGMTPPQLSRPSHHRRL